MALIQKRNSNKKLCLEMTVRNVSYSRWTRIVSEALEILRQCTDDIDDFYVCFDVLLPDKNIKSLSTKKLSVHTVNDLWCLIKEANNTSWAELYRLLNSYLKLDSGILSSIPEDGELLEMNVYNGDKMYISVHFRDLYVSVAIAESLAKIYDSDITEDIPVIERKRRKY